MRRWLAALALLAGCSAIPAGEDPALEPALREARSSWLEPAGRLAIAPVVTFTLAAGEAAKGWQRDEARALDPDDVRRSIVRAVGASGAWEGARLATADALSDAWSRGEDHVLEVAIEELWTRFDGHNGWWIPNVVNFLTNTPFSWWVATERYSLGLAVSFRLQSAGSGAALASGRFDVEVQGTFDEFDRGWQPLGPIWPSLDAEGWQGIASRLFPAARTRLAVELALRAGRALRDVRASAPADDRERGLLAVVVGVGRYEDSRAFPPLSHAAEDALAFAQELRGLGSLPYQLLALTDREATVAGVTSAIDALLASARPRDRVVVYFAGYGTRAADGSAVLLLHDADASREAGLLRLDALARKLESAPGQKLLVVDCGFGGGGRSIGSAAPARDDEGSVGRLDLALVLACGRGEPSLAPEHLRHGLLTYRFIEGLERARRAEGPRRLDVATVFPQVHAAVVADAELLGARQSPRLLGAGAFAFPVREGLRAGAREAARDRPR